MKTSFQARQGIRKESGQAMVETVIVLPALIFFILATIQLTLMHQARLMLEYAAFNAARVGAVWNADPEKMGKAATLSLVAARPSWPYVGNGGLGVIQDYDDLLVAAIALMGVDSLTSLLEMDGLKLIKVDVLNPKLSDFGDAQEIDFDNAGNGTFDERRKSQLSVRVTFWFKMIIPFANGVIWNALWEKRCNGLKDAQDLLELVNTIFQLEGDDRLGVGGRSPFRAFKYIRYNVLGKSLGWGLGDMSTEDQFEGLSDGEWMTMWLASMAGAYYVPLVTANTIRMQSNPYRKYFEPKE